MKEIAIRKDVIKKDVFYETEKASERMEDMHLFIQTAWKTEISLQLEVGIDRSSSGRKKTLPVT